MSKRDRQGVRTPAQLEQKYSFGSDQKTVKEIRRLVASFTKEAGEMRSQMAKIQAELDKLSTEFILAAIVETDGAWALLDTTYAELKSAWETGRCIVLYTDQSGGGRRYYHCMCCDASAALVFQYGLGTAVQYITVGADGVSVETLALAVE